MVFGCVIWFGEWAMNISKCFVSSENYIYLVRAQISSLIAERDDTFYVAWSDHSVENLSLHKAKQDCSLKGPSRRTVEENRGTKNKHRSAMLLSFSINISIIIKPLSDCRMSIHIWLRLTEGRLIILQIFSV